MVQCCFFILLLPFLYCSVAAGPVDIPAGGLLFVENRGQVVDMEGVRRPDILFTADAPGMKLYCRRSGISYVFIRREKPQYHAAIPPDSSTAGRPVASGNSGTTTVYRLDVEFEGAQQAQVVAGGTTQEYFNYYYAHCPEGITNVYAHKKVLYRNLYPNIDLVLYTQAEGLKYDFIVHPGGDPRHIRLTYSGAEAPVPSNGAIRVQTPLGILEEKKPYTYQGEREIPSRYTVRGNTVGFDIGDYDTARPLVIDPDVIWSTYYGGGSEDWGYDVATDPDRNVIITGYTISIDFPVENALQTATNDDFDDAFVVKLTPDGKRLWATYYGGSRDDIAVGVSADRFGGIAVVGRTGSTDFPIENAWQSSRGGAFVLKMTPDGRRAWATCLGGGDDAANGVAADINGGVVVLGETSRSSFPVVNALQPSLRGTIDIFIARFTSSGNVLWSTYFGGTGEETYSAPWGCDAIAVDNSNNIVVGGTTTSTDFPLRAPLQPTSAGRSECFIAKLTMDGGLIWSTYYGGQDHDYTYSLTTDGHDNILVCGATFSSDFPVQSPFQPALSGREDAFVLKLTAEGQRLWATYYGGEAREEAYGIAFDNRDNVFITGWTESSALPVFDPWQASSAGGQDGFIAGFDQKGQRIWSTYFGGNDNSWFEKVHGITSDNGGHIIIVGATGSTDLPMLNALQPEKRGSADAFIVKFGCAIPRPQLSPAGTIRFCHGDSATITATPGYDSYLWSNGATTTSIVVRDAGVYTVHVKAGPTCTSRALPVQVEVFPRPVPEIIGPAVLCEGSRAILRANTPYAAYRWSSGATLISTASQVEITGGGAYTLTATDANGCIGTSAAFVVTPVQRPATHIALTPSGSASICPGDSIVLTAVGEFSSYRWSNGATTAGITVREPGTYSVVVTDRNGCTSQAVSQKIDGVQLLEASLLGPPSSCTGSEEEYSVQPQPDATYEWTLTGGAFTTNPEQPVVRVRWTQPGTGTLVVTSRKQHCLTTTTLTVSIADSLQPRISGVLELCTSGTTELRVEGEYSRYEWTGGTTSAALIVDTPGSYTVRVSNGAGCSGSTTATVRAGHIPQPRIVGAASVCPGSAILYTAENIAPTSTFLWTVHGGVIAAGQSTASITVQWGGGPTGEIAVQVLEPAGTCEGEGSLAVAVEGVLYPVLTVVPATPCQGEPVVLSVGEFSSYLWTTGETTASITVTSDGVYGVVVSDGSGCRGTTSAVVHYRGVSFGQSESVVWNDVGAGTTIQLSRTWTNHGTEPVRVESWSLVPDLPEYDVEFTPLLPADIPPGKALQFTVRFRPQQSGDYSTELVVESSLPCTRTLRISFEATTAPVALLASLPDTTAFPWQRGYKIPLYTRLTGGTAIAQTVEFTVAMDATVFFPTGLTRGVITGTTVNTTTGERVITGRVDNVEFSGNRTVVTEIVGDVLLGERDSTLLILQQFGFAGDSAEKEHGVLRLEGICREGEARFVRSTEGFGISIQPHPVENELVALVEVVEVGNCSLELYSADGRREVLRQWVHRAGGDGAAIVRYDVSTKGAGVYWLVLRTPTQTETTGFLIVK